MTTGPHKAHPGATGLALTPAICAVTHLPGATNTQRFCATNWAVQKYLGPSHWLLLALFFAYSPVGTTRAVYKKEGFHVDNQSGLEPVLDALPKLVLLGVVPPAYISHQVSRGRMRRIRWNFTPLPIHRLPCGSVCIGSHLLSCSTLAGGYGLSVLSSAAHAA